MLLLMGNVATALAGTRLFMEDFSITAGEVRQVAVNLTNDVDVLGMNFDVYLPQGLEFVEDSYAKNPDRTGRAFSLACEQQQTGAYRFLLVNTNFANISGNEGAIVYFKVKATGMLSKASYIDISNVTLTGNKGTAAAPDPYTIEDVDVDGASVAKVAKLNGTVKLSATESVSVMPGGTAKVDVILDNTATLAGMQCDINIPEGLTIVAGADGLFEYTDRIPQSGTITYNPQTGESGKYTVAISSLVNDTIIGRSGALFSFTVKADEKFAADAAISIDRFIVADLAANAYILDDKATVAVKNALAGAYADALAAITKLNDSLATVGARIEAECPNVKDSAFVAEGKAVAQAMIDAFAAEVEKMYAEGTLTAEGVNAKVAEINAAIGKLMDDALAAQKAYEEEQAAKVAANEEAYARLNKALEGIQTKKDNTALTVSTSCPDVATQFADRFGVVQTKIDSLKNVADSLYKEVELTAESSFDKDIEALTAELLAIAADAGAAQKAYENKVAANEAAYIRLTAQIAEVQDALDAAVTTINTDYAEIAANYTDDAAEIQKAIDALTKTVEDQYAAIELTATSKVDTKSVLAMINDMLAKAEKEYETVGISGVTAGAEGAEYFSLSGRKIAAPAKGSVVVMKTKAGVTKKIIFK